MVSSPTRLPSRGEELVDPSCVEDLLSRLTGLSLLATAVMDNLLPVLESELVARTFMRMKDQMDIAVTRVNNHPEYDDWTISNDICILELADSADLSSQFIDVISLPSSGEEYSAGTVCTVSGWGTTSEGGSLGRVLQKVDVPVVSDDDCRDSYGSSSVYDSMICAGLPQGGKDSCQGDSGGPFMCGNQLSGIVSWGYGCAEPGYPGVYTQTSYFIDWINNNL